MNTYAYDTISLSKIAIHLAKQDDVFIREAVDFVNKNDNEDGYIQISNMIFEFYNSLYNTASTEAEKQNVISSMCNAFKNVFDNRYLPIRCWQIMLHLRTLHGHIQDCVDDAKELIDLLNEEKHPITTMYIYRKIANYIVSGGLFFTEPYTSMLDNIVSKIENAEFDLSKQPNYLS